MAWVFLQMIEGLKSFDRDSRRRAHQVVPKSIDNVEVRTSTGNVQNVTARMLCQCVANNSMHGVVYLRCSLNRTV